MTTSANNTPLAKTSSGGFITRRHLTLAAVLALALVWALAAVAPVMLLQGLTTGFLGPGPAVAVVNLLAGGAFLVFWISGLRALSQQRQPA